MTTDAETLDRTAYPACVPELVDGRVRLRAHRPEDAARIVEQSRDPLSAEWTTVPIPYGDKDAHDFLGLIRDAWQSDEGHRYWAIEWDDPDGGPRYVGTIDLRPKGRTHTAEVGFGLHPDARGHGVMASALRLVCRWWFAHDGERVYWYANAGNIASWRVAWACGFRWHTGLPDFLDHRCAAVGAWVASVGRDDDLERPAAPWLDPPTLERDGVRLRAWAETDIGDTEADPDLPSHFIPPGAMPSPTTFPGWLDQRRMAMARGLALHWCIADAVTDRALGGAVVILADQAEGSAELGYQLFRAARGRGAATIAARLASEYALRPEAEGGMGLRRLVALTVGDNSASARVLERVGFSQWGREPGCCLRADGSADDALHWVLGSAD
ncbi:GNAT family N-acetyltransferase [Actinomycetota bacterium]